MSRIVTHRKCDNCGCEYDGYWSYGHPDHDIHYEWKCKECGYINHKVAKAWPMGDLGWVKLSELKVEQEVNLINNMIVQAILHGADSGGSYDMNEENLINAICDWIKFKQIQKNYEICIDAKVILDDTSYLECPQIQKKE